MWGIIWEGGINKEEKEDLRKEEEDKDKGRKSGRILLSFCCEVVLQ